MGQSEDDLAYFRDEPEFRTPWLFELPIGDFAFTICRQLVASLYFVALYRRCGSDDATLAGIAAKAVKEVAYHAEHAMLWTKRLALGTEESRGAHVRALEDLWPFIGELFPADPLIDRLDGIAVRPSTSRPLRRRHRPRPRRSRPRGAGRFHLRRRRTTRRTFPDARLPPGRDAGARTTASWCDMVTAAPRRPCDPPPASRMVDRREGSRPRGAGADDRRPRRLRAVEVDDERATVTITPTYSGCPALEAIREDVVLALTEAGYANVEVRRTLSPAWTTDWMSDDGKRKLTAYGIAPPTGRRAVAGPDPRAASPWCPRCGSLDTREIARFGSTSCKALCECRACLEPFDHFKVL